MYSIIYADPAWDYKGQVQHNTKEGNKSAVDHYNTLTLEQLKKINVKSICEKDCLLFMWTSSPHLDQAIELMNSWGFKYSTIAFVWDKQKTNPSYYTLSRCEICIVGKKGKIPTPRGSRKERQFISEMRTFHSKKPDEVRDRITRMFPTQKKLEMFARQKYDGYDVFGNQVEGSITIDTLP
jgi:N6-adenosine-specific RNA methylase IME4